MLKTMLTDNLCLKLSPYSVKMIQAHDDKVDFVKSGCGYRAINIIFSQLANTLIKQGWRLQSHFYLKQGHEG